MADRQNLACSGSRWRAGRAGGRASEREWAINSVRMQISAIMKGESQAEKSPKNLRPRLECGGQHACSTTPEKAALPFQYPGWKLTPYHMQEWARWAVNE